MGKWEPQESQVHKYCPNITLKRLVKSSRRAVKSRLLYNPLRAFRHFRRTSRCYWGKWKYDWLLFYSTSLGLHTTPTSDYAFWASVSSIPRILRYSKDNEWLILLLKKIKGSQQNLAIITRRISGYHPSICITNPSITFLLFHRESLSPLYSDFEAFHFLDRSFSFLSYPTLLNTGEVPRFSALMGWLLITSETPKWQDQEKLKCPRAGKRMRRIGEMRFDLILTLSCRVQPIYFK